MAQTTEFDLKVGDIWESPNGNHFLKITPDKSLPLPNLNSKEPLPKFWLDDALQASTLTKAIKVGKIKYKS